MHRDLGCSSERDARDGEVVLLVARLEQPPGCGQRLHVVLGTASASSAAICRACAGNSASLRRVNSIPSMLVVAAAAGSKQAGLSIKRSPHFAATA